MTRLAGARKNRRRGLVAFEFAAGKQDVEVIIALAAAVPGAGEEGAFAADDQRAVGGALLALEEIGGGLFQPVIPHQFHRRFCAAGGEVDFDDAPLWTGFIVDAGGVFHLNACG